jgi:hypothetical protein
MFKDPGGKWFFLVPFAVGFVAGLIYGLADGQKWDAFGTALETGLTTGFGALLGGLTAGSLASGGGMVGAVMGGVNGLFTGLRKTYEWSKIEGWASFASDSTWGLIGTSIGNVLNIVNLVVAPSSYDSGNSMRQNRQVYDRGFNLTGGTTAFTQGNVISNLDRGNPGSGSGILKHESTHILQNRLFGPIYIGTNIAWYAYSVYYGFWLGPVLWPFIGQNPAETIRQIGHDDNPWKLWAFSAGGESRSKGKLSI